MNDADALNGTLKRVKWFRLLIALDTVDDDQSCHKDDEDDDNRYERLILDSHERLILLFIFIRCHTATRCFSYISMTPAIH